jgi:hypothetical protein
MAATQIKTQQKNSKLTTVRVCPSADGGQETAGRRTAAPQPKPLETKQKNLKLET